MKSTELMIGDWVKDKYKPNPHKVDSWADFNTAEDLSPIPLTQEILEKNGFRENRSDLQYVFYNGWNIMISNKKTDVSCSPILYVHELQHALRLCGLNELANNFKI